jgi:hypothetical protein
LETQLPRDDYKELAELSLLVMGVQPTTTSYNFKMPGANHRARWMAHVIYSLKNFLLRDEYKLEPEQAMKFREISLFFCLIYAKNWMTAPLAAQLMTSNYTLS